MTYLQKIFFELLQIAIGNKVGLSRMPSQKEWLAIYKMAKQQTMIGIVFCGIERYVNTNKAAILGPPIGKGNLPVPLFMDWRGQLEKIKTKNDVADEACRNVIADFEAMGCHAALLKGQANAHIYKGELGFYRTSGDIDIWAVKEGMTLDESRKAMARMALEKLPGAYVQPHHVDYEKKDGIPVELHFTPSPVFNPFYDRKVQRYFENVIKNRYEEFPVVDGIRRLPLDVDFVFQLLHLRRHLITEGVGMKQVIDLYYVLHNLDPLDREMVKEKLSVLGLKPFAGAMMWIFGECFGLSKDEMICKPDEKRGRFMLEEIIKGGNFGRYDTERGDDGETKLEHLVYYTRLAWRCLRYFPGEAFWNPFYRIGVGIWQKRHGF